MNAAVPKSKLTDRLLNQTNVGIVFLSAVLWTSCAREQEDSRTNDIFQEDNGDSSQGNSRRHPATNDEKLWSITMSGCTGHLISPDYMMTANHCKASPGARYKSGYAVGRNQQNDITVTQVVESSAELDYAILKISWTTSYPKDQRFPPKIAIKASDINFGRESGTGDELFTVGYPQDKFGSWGATYSQGRAKIAQGARLYYDIGIINGNSGGGVWRKSDNMLVSLTNGGAHAFGQAGWDTAAITSSANWNFGPPIWSAYEQSAILKDVFPNGKNRFTRSEEDQVSNDVSVLIGTAASSAVDTYTLFFSVPETSSTLIFCSTISTDNCDENASGFTKAVLQKTVNGRKYYKAAQETSFINGMHLSMVARDEKGKKTAAMTIKLKAE